jgi:hypothetical protein
MYPSVSLRIIWPASDMRATYCLLCSYARCRPVADDDERQQ